ncbi:conserved hypothetical protein [Gloeothece citriformis PCC 7424]|uniref:Uncharacterized protein n=1 Tax=Gloeothece citriformis (strain PCC 7424) TaxID=65393 RepID=B7KAQ7_GLOC7|nr:hypothetical protein [Gloeothece citriformis]ACK68729.1 conserved hypothetical protein [Gloeothece citriformis PCC 7424]
MQLKHYLTLGGIILGCMIGIVSIQQPKLQALTETGLNSSDYHRAEDLEKIKLDILKKAPTFGFSNLLASWTFLQFVQYYGDNEARKVTGYSLSPEYLEIITQNDPLFVDAYLRISPASSMNAGRPDRTVAIMNQGLKSLTPKIPYAHYVWLYKGVDELLFLGKNQQAKQSYQMAADWATQAKDDKIAKSATKTAQFLAENPDSKTAQVGAWFMVFVNSTDQETQLLAKNKIENLGGKLTIYADGRVSATPPEEN